MKILVTGAAGLLGSAICRTLEDNRSRLSLDGLIRQRLRDGDGYFSADLTRTEDWLRLAALEWDVMIHTAAVKDPERCESDPAGAVMLNVAATTFLADEAARRGAYFIYICTDYVFAGTQAPYDEAAHPGPVNYYGLTKRQGEQAVLTASDRFASLRVPILYGLSAGINNSGALAGLLRNILDRREQEIEDVIVRYPTWNGDVAAAVTLLLQHRAAGIFHCTAEERSTKYWMAADLARTLGLPSDHLRPATALSGGAKRPLDAHLSWDRLKQLGFPGCRPYTGQIMTMREEIAAALADLKK